MSILLKYTGWVCERAHSVVSWELVTLKITFSNISCLQRPFSPLSKMYTAYFFMNITCVQYLNYEKSLFSLYLIPNPLFKLRVLKKKRSAISREVYRLCRPMIMKKVKNSKLRSKRRRNGSPETWSGRLWQPTLSLEGTFSSYYSRCSWSC